MPRDKSRAYIKGGLQMSMEEAIKITASVAKRKSLKNNGIFEYCAMELARDPTHSISCRIAEK